MSDTALPVTLDLASLYTGRSVMILESQTTQPVGLLLCRRYMADLILEGSLLGGSTDARGCERLIPLGSIQLIVPPDDQSRQQGFERRLQSIHYQQQVIGEPTPTERARKLLELLYASFDPGLINTLADSDLAKAAGVLPATITRMKERYRGRSSDQQSQVAA